MTNHDQIAYGTFLLRLSLGVMFVSHGLMKLFVFGPAGTAGFFESLGVPGVLGYLTISGETGGGLLLIAGLGSRYVLAALLPVLAASILFVHGDKGWVFSNPGGGWEYPAFLLAASVAQLLLGEGALALSNRLPRARTEASRPALA